MINYQDARKNFITCDPSCLQMLDDLPDTAMSEAGVLIIGETGSGKEVIANAIHHLGPRANRPFITVDCGTREPEILEIALFGHEKGAYTGAVTSRAGLVAIADGGTLFFDEINSTTNELQKRLMRFLETHTFYSMGSVKESVANVRIIAAANFDINMAIAEGKLREDIYHRLCPLEIHIPPLRSRRDDIPLIAKYFAEKFRLLYKKPDTILSDQVLEYLVDHPLHGNVRELHYLIERGFIKCKNKSVRLGDILVYPPPEINFTYDEWTKKGYREVRRDYLRTLMDYHRGVVAKAAETADQKRPNFYKKLLENDIDPDDYRLDKNSH